MFCVQFLRRKGIGFLCYFLGHPREASSLHREGRPQGAGVPPQAAEAGAPRLSRGFSPPPTLPLPAFDPSPSCFIFFSLWKRLRHTKPLLNGFYFLGFFPLMRATNICWSKDLLPIQLHALLNLRTQMLSRD